MNPLKTICHADLAALGAAAAASARRRQNFNLHPSHDDPVQRFLNAFEPGTYVRPHRHHAPPKWELMTRLRGRVVLLVFDDHGVVQTRIELDENTPVVEIPGGAWHALAALESGTVLLEVKSGPYAPATPADFADWSPAEGSAPAATLEAWYRTARIGERAPR